ncbi:hypothetical protein [Microbacterium sp. SA39]|uniref:hypothetical protein n=1 Tax=Microbacterium sp. SA39 TaxID=1263625 RepID=UPI001269E4F0|nr:hypothetical protein [Microbacterium sp. SA39]
MEDYPASFLALIDREPADLTPYDRESLEYIYASINLAEGLPADSPPRVWCLMAQSVGRIAHMLGRLPQAGDPGATAEILAWVAAQDPESLNGYQRARLSCLPGMWAVIRPCRPTLSGEHPSEDQVGPLSGSGLPPADREA